jgi:hypothetical protein
MCGISWHRNQLITVALSVSYWMMMMMVVVVEEVSLVAIFLDFVFCFLFFVWNTKRDVVV